MRTVWKILIGILAVFIITIIILRRVFPFFLSEEYKQSFYDLTKKTTDVLDEHNVPYFAIAGTLLGIVRHREIIPWDHDVDIGILEKDLPKVQSIDWGKYGLRGEGIEKTNTGKVFLKDGKLWVDIFVFKKTDKGWEYANPEARKTWPGEYFPVSELLPLKKYKFGPIMISGPNKTEPYCLRAWGKDWRKPYFGLWKTLLHPEKVIKSKMLYLEENDLL